MEKCKIVKNVKIRVFHENPCFHQNSWKCHRETWYFRKWHFRQKSLFFWFFLVKNHVKTPYVLARCWRVLSDRVEKPGFSVIFRDFRCFRGFPGFLLYYSGIGCTTVGTAVLQWEMQCQRGCRTRTTVGYQGTHHPGTPIPGHPTHRPTDVHAGWSGGASGVSAAVASSPGFFWIQQAAKHTTFGQNRKPLKTDTLAKNGHFG